MERSSHMKGTYEPRGVIATVSTPFLENGKIDYESLEENISGVSMQG